MDARDNQRQIIGNTYDNLPTLNYEKSEKF